MNLTEKLMRIDRFGGDISWLSVFDESRYYHILNAMEENATTATRDGMHLNTPYSLSKLGQLFKAIDNYQDQLQDNEESYRTTSKVLDAGCGTGHVVALAASIFYYEAHGIDVQEKYITRAALLCSELGLTSEEVQFTKEDALSFERYGDYDIVILNRLFVGPGQQSHLEAKVWSDLPEGAYLVKVNNITSVAAAHCEYIASDGLGGTVIRKPLT